MGFIKNKEYELLNEKRIKYIGQDDWCRNLFKLKASSGNIYTIVYLEEEEKLYSYTDEGEPDCPLLEDFQIKMQVLTKRQYEHIHTDYRGVFEDFQGLSPELIGTRTMLLPNNGGLGFEGIHFVVID